MTGQSGTTNQGDPLGPAERGGPGPLTMYWHVGGWRLDALFAIVVLAVGAVYVQQALAIRVPRVGDPLGPRAFPVLIGVILMVCAASLLARSWLSRKDGEGSRAAGRSYPLAVLAVAAWVGFYIFLLPRLGFILACALFLIGLAAALNPGRWLTNVGMAVLFPLGAYLLFTRALSIPLARGILPL